MMKVDSAAPSFKLITFLIMRIMSKLNHFIFNYFIYVSFARMSSCNRFFSYLGSGFGALEYRSPQRTNTPPLYIVHYIAIHMHAKAFYWFSGGNDTL